MHKSKLITLLDSFSNKDWKVCKKFVRTQAETSNEPEILYNYIYDYKSRLWHKNLDIDLISKKVLVGKSRKGIQNVMSKLVILIEDYLTWDWLEQNKVEKDLILLQALDKRVLYKLSDSKIEQIAKDIEQSKERKIEHNLNTFILNKVRIESHNPSKLPSLKSIFSNIIESMEVLTKNSALYYQIAYTSFPALANDHDKSIWNNLEEITRRDAQDYLTPILSKTKQIQLENDQQTFLKLKNDLLENRLELSDKVKKTILGILIKNRVNLVIKNLAGAIDETLHLYEYGVDSGLLLVQNHLSPVVFTNIIGIASSQKKTQWAYNFLDNYNHLVEDRFREETIISCEARINFDQHNFDKVIELLSTRKSLKQGLVISMRWMLLCSYFMKFQNNHSFLNSIFRNFSNYLNRNKKKISKKNFEASSNLLNILKSQLKNNTKENLLRELSIERPVIYRNWLQNMYEEKEPTR